MQDRILMMVPSRSRPEKIQEFIETWDSLNPTRADLLIATDDDDCSNYIVKSHTHKIVPRRRLLPTLNVLALENMDGYKYLGFAGDDHRFRTPEWDIKCIDQIASMGGKGIVYGDDLLQREELPTAVILSSNIVKALGYMVPTSLIHLYADNFWKILGNMAGILKYMPEIIIEHMHFTAGKSAKDELYAEVNSHAMYQQDSKSFEAYLASSFEEDVKKVLNV